jgi:phosphoglycerate dehydrogenase-like enzyme
MLALGKKLVTSDRALREGGYDATRIRPIDDVAYNWVGFSDIGGLYGKTLGIVGLGEVGTLVARLARAFGMRVLYTKRNKLSEADERALGLAYGALPALLGDADVVSLHVPGTPQNEKLAGAAFFGAMKRSAFFVNTSRGRLVDEEALFQALLQGRIAGAGLDVHRVEPRAPHDRFATLPNVVLTPHLAGGARSGVLQELEIILRNCHAALRGETPRFAVTPARLRVD